MRFKVDESLHVEVADLGGGAGGSQVIFIVLEARSMKTANPDLIEEIVRRVASAVHPLRVILFGSAARGEMGSKSDIDLLIVVPDGTRRRDASRRAYRALSGLGISKDVIVVTESDVKKFGETHPL